MEIYDFLKVKTDLTKSDKEIFLTDGIVIPPLFNLFSSLFELGSETLSKIEYKEEDELYQLGTWSFIVNGEDIHLDNFMSLNEIEHFFQIFSQDVEWLNHKLLRVAYLGQAGFGGLYLGCSSENLDEIWIFNADSKHQYTKVAENIFTFLKLISFNTEFSDYERDYSKLYKKWGRNFGEFEKKMILNLKNNDC